MSTHDCTVEQSLKKPMAEELLFGKLKKGGSVTVDVDPKDKEKLIFLYEVESDNPPSKRIPKESELS